jgi:hypothetical protein
VPDSRKHRGPHPQDEQWFALDAEPILDRAVWDLSWLLTRGYPITAALKLVGDRFQLTERQRIAVMRCSCSDRDRLNRQRNQVACKDLSGRVVELDGFNVLTTVEAALAGGILLLARDGWLRDMASMHGSFRRVEETCPALECVGRVLAELNVSSARWFLDRPVSNSGRLAATLRQTALRHAWPWQADLVDDVDGLLARSVQIVATADAAILDRCSSWCNLAREVISRQVPDARMLRLTGASREGHEDDSPAAP